MTRVAKKLVLPLLLVTGLGVGWLLQAPLVAEPVRDRVLEEVRITEVEGQVAIAVRFPCTVRYLTHFPQDQGRELHIRLKPIQICTADRDAFAARESVRPRHAEAASLIDVTYEGDIEGGPFLNLSFTEDLAWQVKPDTDFRGLLILISPL